MQKASSIFSYSLSLKLKLLAPLNMVLKLSYLVTTSFFLQEIPENRKSLLILEEWISSLVYLKKKKNLCFPLILEKRPRWAMGPPDAEGAPSTGTVLRDVHKLPELTLDVRINLTCDQIHVCSLQTTRNFCCKMLPEILPPMSSYYNTGHPVLVSRIPKISSFNPHMTFYSLCYRGFDVNKPEVFTENHSERHWREQVNKYRQL